MHRWRFISVLLMVLLIASFLLVSPQSVTASGFEVFNTNDDGAGSLRRAIQDANATPGLDTIDFNILGAGPYIIQPISPLPDITDPVIIDGYTQPGAFPATVGTPAIIMIVLDGSLTVNATGLVVFASGNTIRGLTINNFDYDAIGITPGSNNNTITGNYLGTNTSGTAVQANGRAGIYILSDSNIIGGETPDARNLISGNQQMGIAIDGGSDNTVIGNYIGTDISGLVALPNGNGISIGNGLNNIIGGTTTEKRNLISGNLYSGVSIGAGPDLFCVGNQVLGNYIGVDSSGSAALGNGYQGVLLDGAGATDNVIGGGTPGAGNVISSNISRGIQIGNKASNNQVLGNLIGTDNAGSILGNKTGILIGQGSANNTIGPDNKIWYNTEKGVQVAGNLADFNTITENSIMGNGILGIDLQDDGNDNIPAPAITSVTATTVTGTSTAPDGSVVEIFQDAGNQGNVYIGFAIVAGNSFTFNGNAPAGGNLTATVTDVTGNTSEFSTPVTNNLEPPPGGETEVGGDIYPVSQVMLLIPWIGLVIALIIGSAIMIRRYRT